MGEKGESPMKPTLTQNEVMVMRFEHTYGKYQSGAITCEGVAEILGISLSTFYRMRQKYDAYGAEGIEIDAQ